MVSLSCDSWILVLILFRAIWEQSMNNKNDEQNLGWNAYTDIHLGLH